MIIKSIILDGFKSYAKRTEIVGFDPYFNAITGLNGSGKSNILDGICFLLGISNLSQVRANNLQELIYQGGQTGVTRASVTVTFDNTDKTQCPVGYEDFEELVITRIISVGGKCKYLINGCNASNSKIHDLFCSVQMNVNNPNFLIMQGKITKVLNMKPPEILSMIEETVGTQMYETKRQNALKTMEKKEFKLNEIKGLLDDEITPTIIKLKEERSSFLEYQKLSRELEHIKRVLLGYEYVSFQKSKDNFQLKIGQTIDSISHLNGELSELSHETQEIETTLTDLQSDFDIKSGGSLCVLQEKCQKFLQIEAKCTSDYQNSLETIENFKRIISSCEIKLANFENNINVKNNSIIDENGKFENMKSSRHTNEELVNKLRDQLQAITIGCGSAASTGGSLTELLLEAKSNLAKMQTSLANVNLKIGHVSKSLTTKKEEMKQAGTGDSGLFRTQNEIVETISALENDKENCDFNPELYENLKSERAIISKEFENAKSSLDSFETKNHNCFFRYSANVKDSDFSFKIKGMVCDLCSVKEEKYFSALEATAGGKLRNVVVDTDETSKKLSKIGKFERRTFFIPLNRVVPYVLSHDKISAAVKLVGNKVRTALSLLEYDPKLSSAIEFVFGNTLICDSHVEAKLLAFHESVKCRCVTLEGDVFDPSGILTGGSRSTDSLLRKMKTLNKLRSILRDFDKKIKDVDVKLWELESSSSKYEAITKELESHNHELKLINVKLKSSPTFRLQEEVQELQKDLESLRKDYSTLNKQIEEENVGIMELESKSENEDKHKQERINDVEKQLNVAKKTLSDLSTNLYKQEDLVQTLLVELEELKSEKSKTESQLDAGTRGLTKESEDLNHLEKQMNDAKKCLSAMESEIALKKQQMMECSNKIQEYNKRKVEVNKKIHDVSFKIKELEQEVSKLTRQVADISSKILSLEQKHEWIVSEKKQFNVSGGSYDFNQINMKELNEKHVWLESSTQKISRKINTRAMNMLSHAEEKYNDLMRKKKIVMADKSKIQDVIGDLDKKKLDALIESWKKVNADFGSIFSTLLPGSSAKLEIPSGKSITDGLEIKVGFGNTWKEGLNELSGGQRSLVALSLILSLLLFKPAPIYILDEVDAALDLSHTQNIGMILKSHFRKSQFIIVSLKDGMFSNANVLFKTRFVDGISTVTSHRQTTSSRKEDETEYMLNVNKTVKVDQ